MGDCVWSAVGGGLVKGVVWLMCVFNQAHAQSPEGKKIKEKKNTKTTTKNKQTNLFH